MTVYVLSEIGWEYNDEDYYRSRFEGVKPVKVFRSIERADAECAKLNRAERSKRDYMVNGDGKPIKEFYEVLEIEIDEGEVL